VRIKYKYNVGSRENEIKQSSSERPIRWNVFIRPSSIWTNLEWEVKFELVWILSY